MITFKDTHKIRKLLKQKESETLGIPRQEMPQISGDNIEEVFEWLASQEILVVQKQITPSQYKPTQKHFNADKVLKLCNNSDTQDMHFSKPVLVSNDGYIIDGHHRYLAHICLDDRQLKVAEIDLPIDECLQLLSKYDNVFYKGINESINQYVWQSQKKE